MQTKLCIVALIALATLHAASDNATPTNSSASQTPSAAQKPATPVLDPAKQEIHCTVYNVLSHHDLLAKVGWGTTIHIEGLETYELSRGTQLDLNVWPLPPYPDVTLFGGKTQIANYTATKPVAPPAH